LHSGAFRGACPRALPLLCSDAFLVEPIVDRAADLLALEHAVSYLDDLQSFGLLVVDPKRIAFAWRHNYLYIRRLTLPCQDCHGRNALYLKIRPYVRGRLAALLWTLGVRALAPALIQR